MAKVNIWFEESYTLAGKVWSALAEWIPERPDIDFVPVLSLVLAARGQIEGTAPKRAFELLEAAFELAERLSQEDGFRTEFLARVAKIRKTLNKADPDGWALLKVLKFEVEVTAMTNLELCEKRWDLIPQLEEFETKADRTVARLEAKSRKNKSRRDYDSTWQNRLGYAPASA